MPVYGYQRGLPIPLNNNFLFRDYDPLLNRICSEFSCDPYRSQFQYAWREIENKHVDTDSIVSHKPKIIYKGLKKLLIGVDKPIIQTIASIIKKIMLNTKELVDNEPRLVFCFDADYNSEGTRFTTSFLDISFQMIKVKHFSLFKKDTNVINCIVSYRRRATYGPNPIEYKTKYKQFYTVKNIVLLDTYV